MEMHVRFILRTSVDVIFNQYTSVSLLL